MRNPIFRERKAENIAKETKNQAATQGHTQIEFLSELE